VAEDRVTAVEETSRRRRTFGPVVLLGLASSGLAAIASAKPWIGVTASKGAADASMTAIDTGTRFPLASAVSLVLLASWGVLLVTRGVVRRGFALFAALASVGLVATVVAAYVTLPDQARDTTRDLISRGTTDTGFSGWFWTAAVAAVLAVVPAVLAVRLVGSWPEMGSRYDAPGAGEVEQEPETEQELWKALDEGRDPTDTARP
jgi:uncharacterized membrane protein (TIGR02234 family)